MLSGTQWASSVSAYSSQWSSTSWAASQALGSPDTFSYGDIPSAWAPLPVNGAQEFLQVGFDTPVNATGVAIRETCGNGFVTQVDLIDTDGQAHPIFSGSDSTPPGAPGYLALDFSATSYLVDGVAIYVDTNHDLTTWEEIDAVALTDSYAPNPPKLAATIVVNAYNGTYDGTAHGLAGSATGTDNSDLTSLLELGSTETDVGTYSIPWTFGGNADYAAASGTSTINIGQADATISVSPYSGTYDGSSHSPSGTATGILGEDLSTLLNLGTRQTDAGSYQASWSFAGNADYSASRGSSTIDISQANANISITPYSGSYDGSAHGLAGTATGITGEDLSGLLDLGATQTDSGSYQPSWTFAGNTDYAPASGTSTIDIGQAGATVAVTPYSGSYDGAAHAPSGTATGVNGEDLSSLLDLGAPATDVGSYQTSWSFVGNTDYAASSGTSTIDITAVRLTVTADNLQMASGAAVPQLTYTSVGLVSGDALSGALATDVTSASSIGTYEIDQGTLAASDNYSLTFIAGTLTVIEVILINPGDQTNAVVEPVTTNLQAFDSAGFAVTFSATGLPPGLSLDSTSSAITGTIAGDAEFGSPYSVTIWATDGTASDSQTFNWTVNPPVVTLFSPGDQVNPILATVNCSLRSSDSAGFSLTFSGSGLPPGMTIDQNTGVISGTIASDASAGSPYTVTVSATDGAASASQTFEWTVNPATVTFFGPGDELNYILDSVFLSLGSNDSAGLPLTFSASGLPPGLTIHQNTGVISGIIGSNADAGSPYSVTIGATDGIATASETFAWNVDGITLTLSNPGSQVNQLLDTVNMELTASDSANFALSFSAVGLPPGLTIDPTTGTITGTIARNAAPGNSVTVSVTDGVVTASQTFAWTINGPTVSINNPGDQENQILSPVSVGLIAFSSAALPLIYSATGLPPGLVIDPSSGVITGNIDGAADTASVYQVTITVTDGTDDSQTSFAWKLESVVLFTPIIDQSYSAGANVDLIATATDAYGLALTYSAENLPPGLTINPSTGEISGTIAVEAGAEVYIAIVSATDGTNSGSTFLKFSPSQTDGSGSSQTVIPVVQLIMPDKVYYGQPVELEAIVTATGWDIESTVTFYDNAGTTVLNTVNVLDDPITGLETATLTWYGFTVGQHIISALFNGYSIVVSNASPLATLNVVAIPPPTPISPVGQITSLTPTFTWSPVTGMSYEFWLKDASTGALVVDTNLTATSYTPGLLTLGDSYVWSVASISPSDSVRSWSSPNTSFSIVLAPPTLISPVNNATVTTMQPFLWSAVLYAYSYEIWVNDNTTGAPQVVHNGNVTGTSYTPGVTLAIGDHYTWWVRAVSANGLVGSWSVGQTFSTTAAPSLLSPVTGTIGTLTPQLSWASAIGAARYWLWVNDNTTGVSQVVNQRLATTSYNVTQPLSWSHSYTWWVGSLGANDTNSAYPVWSSGATFTIALAAPLLFHPRGQHPPQHRRFPGARYQGPRLTKSGSPT